MSLLVHMPLTKDYDNKGSIYVGTTNNGTTLNSSGYCVFSGNQYIKLSNDWMTQGEKELTICVKAYMNDWSTFPSYRKMFSCAEGGGFTTDASGSNMILTVHVYTDASLSSSAYASFAPSIALSSLSSGWHSFAFVYTLREMFIYVDGVLASSIEGTSYGIHYNTSVNLYLGCESAPTPPDPSVEPYFNGYLKDFRIYNKVIPQSIIDFIHKSDSYEAILNGGIGVPKTLSTSSFIKYNESSRGAKGYTDSTGSIESSSAIPTCNGAQTWSGINTFQYSTSTTSCTGFNEEGFLNKDASVIVQNVNSEYLAGMGVAQTVIGDNVYNAVWNDMVDCIEVQDDLIPQYGYCYCFDGKNYYKSSKYMDEGIIGLNSDTYGFIMGDKHKDNQLKLAIAGFVLAYVDKEYPVGTPLTCTEGGILTELKIEDMKRHPESLVATFYKKEPNSKWYRVSVNNRMWVKVK